MQHATCIIVDFSNHTTLMSTAPSSTFCIQPVHLHFPRLCHWTNFSGLPYNKDEKTNDLSFAKRSRTNQWRCNQVSSTHLRTVEQEVPGHRIRQISATKRVYNNSFSTHSIGDWNLLPDTVTAAATLEEFRARLTNVPWAQMKSNQTIQTPACQLYSGNSFNYLVNLLFLFNGDTSCFTKWSY